MLSDLSMSLHSVLGCSLHVTYLTQSAPQFSYLISRMNEIFHLDRWFIFRFVFIQNRVFPQLLPFFVSIDMVSFRVDTIKFLRCTEFKLQNNLKKTEGILLVLRTGLYIASRI